jgi:hypothetical protein
MSGKHSQPSSDRCTCPATQVTHTCVRLDGKQNHNYDENAAQIQIAPIRQVRSVGKPPPAVEE